ncbi:hypothetical protein J437_LFUL016679 [Ladona fulva]|uniref:Uncharacterized protein n=1 Tax=Ladona fulva TaxID=123851 RepID=A0A8K0P6G0_LADFU|nr:hypothetical protein J437_LFUL016679 [Ladona fulva]
MRSWPLSFKGRKGTLLVEFTPQGVTIYSEAYCETLKKLLKNIKHCHLRGMLTCCICLLRDKAKPNTACLSCNHSFNGISSTTTVHILYPDFLGTKNFSDDKEVKGTIEKWLREVEREVTLAYKTWCHTKKCIDL